jgi:S-adenosylmethionine-diacylglycerol 3-amino-3-carboxypropyl transferase
MNAPPPSYFSSLNYTLANEDNFCEAQLVEILGSKHLMCISGSGSRALSLLQTRVESCHIVDFSQDQLDLCKLRELTLKHLSYEEFLGFWGYPPFYGLSSEAREELFYKLPQDEIAMKLKNTLEYLGWPPLLYLGKWEKTFAAFSKVIRFVLGEKNLLPLLKRQNLTDQKAYFETHLKGWRWDFLFRLLGNASLFNALLYKGHFVKKNHPLSHFDYYKSAFDRIFDRTLIRENFFAQLCFFGEIKTREANLPEASQKKFFEIVTCLFSRRFF